MWCCASKAATNVADTHSKPAEYELAHSHEAGAEASSTGPPGAEVPHVSPTSGAAEEVKDEAFSSIQDLLRGEWYNKLLVLIWLRVKAAVRFMVEHEIEPMLKVQSGMDNMHFTSFDLGNTVPLVGPIRVTNTPIGPKMEMNVHYDSDTDIVCEAGIASFGIQHIRFVGEMTVLCTPLIDEIPVIGACCAYFLKPPVIEVIFSEKGGLARLAGNLCPSLMKRAIDTTFASLFVLPNQIVIQLATEDQGVDLAMIKQPKPLSVLQVRVVRAKDLPSSDWSLLGKATSDPYVVLTVGGTEYRSSVVPKTLNPEWPADGHSNHMHFMVFDRDQQIACSVWDYDDLTPDDLLGVTRHMSVKEALDHDGALHLFSKNPEDVDNATDEITPEGQLWLEFTELDVAPGVLVGEKLILTVKIDEITIPANVSIKSAKVRVVITPPEGSDAHAETASRRNCVSPPGVVRRTKEAVTSRNKTLEEVIRRCSTQGVPIETICAVTDLAPAMVQSVLQKQGKVSTTSTTVVEVEATMYIPIPSEVASWNIELTIIQNGEQPLATFSVPMDDLIKAENKHLPGPYELPLKDSERSMEAEIALSLSGMRSRKSRTHSVRKLKPLQMAPRRRNSE